MWSPWSQRRAGFPTRLPGSADRVSASRANRLRRPRRSAPWRERRCSPQSKGLRRGSTGPLSGGLSAALGLRRESPLSGRTELHQSQPRLGSQRLPIPIQGPQRTGAPTSFADHGAPRLRESGDARRSPRASGFKSLRRGSTGLLSGGMSALRLTSMANRNGGRLFQPASSPPSINGGRVFQPASFSP